MIDALIIGSIFLPMAWPLYAALRWRSRCARPILIGGLALFLLAAFTMIAGGIIGSVAGTAGWWTLAWVGDSLLLPGLSWLGESVAMMIAGGILRLALPRD